MPSLYFIFVSTLIVLIMFTLFATRRNINQRAAREVFAALVLILCSLVFFDVSLLDINENIRFMCHELKFFTLVYLAPCTVLIYLEFTENSHALSFRMKLSLFVIPAITIIMILTNRYHHFFRTEMSILVHNNASYVETVSSWLYWVYSSYSYTLYFVGIGILASDYYKRPRIYRGQTGLMVVTSVAAIAVSAASLFRLFPDYGDITLVVCSVVCIMQYITIVKYSYRGVVLNARNLVVGDIDSVVMIFDHKNRLVSSNKDTQKFSETLGLRDGMPENPELSLDGKEAFIPTGSESGEYYSISDKRMYDEKGRITGRVVMFNDITGLKTTVNELEHITTHDYLTGLKNRLAFRHELGQLREPDLPAALICVNVSGMKLINNIFGYDYGDRVIKRMGEEINRVVCMSERNSCARLNGDEMGVILRNVREGDTEAFIETIKARLLEGGGDISEISLEAGFAILEDDTRDAGLLFAGVAESMRKNVVASRSVSWGFLNSLQYSLILLRDKSGERSARITELCERVAERLSLPEPEKERLLLLSVMADVGLLSASPAILRDMGNLTNEQWEEMKLHTVKGHNIALSVLELSGIAEEILWHHERYDGYGYPMHLKGDAIPLLARIFSAVEFFVDAPEQNAHALLRARRGTQFDPEVTDAILE